MISLLICVNICFIFYFIFVVDFMFAIVSKFQLFQIKMLSTIIWTKCKTEPNAQRHRSDWNLVIEFNFFEAEKTNLIPSMADRLSSFHWRAFYKCVYCNKDYDALKITQTQLGRCPDCLNYNTPERSVSCFFVRLWREWTILQNLLFMQLIACQFVSFRFWCIFRCSSMANVKWIKISIILFEVAAYLNSKKIKSLSSCQKMQ